jgi:gastric triacylglycerol lipase
MFDYGEECETASGQTRDCNQREYGSEQPPEYDLTELDGPPIAIFNGLQDKLADSVDVETLLDVLPKDVLVYHKTILGYEHIDFTWASNAHFFVYSNVLELLDMYTV